MEKQVAVLIDGDNISAKYAEEYQAGGITVWKYKSISSVWFGKFSKH